jgi:hypothetical protein
MTRKFYLVIIVFLCFVQFSSAQVTLVEWNFPNSPDDSIADIASTTPNNTSKKISVFGDVASPSFGILSGAQTYSASTTNFHHGNGTKGWVIEFSTLGYSNLNVSSKQMSASNGPRDFKVQYKVGAGGVYIDLPGATNIALNNSFISPTGVINLIPLPPVCDNQPSVYLRWIMTSDLSVINSTTFQVSVSRIDDIRVIANTVFLNPLPVKLLSFDVKALNNCVEIKWATAAEPLNDFFTVEKSSKISDVSILTTIPAKGNFNEGFSYKVFDYKPLEGISYYRIKQTDLNGMNSYTEWKVLKFKTDNDQQLQVTVKNDGIDFTIWPFNITTTAKVCIYSSAGMLIADYHLNLNHTNHINGYYFAQGMYFITVEADGILLKQKFQF